MGRSSIREPPRRGAGAADLLCCRRPPEPHCRARAWFHEAPLQLAVILAGVGGRRPVERPASANLRVNGQQMLKSATQSCIDAALVNAVYAVSGEDAPRRVREIVKRDTPGVNRQVHIC